MKKVNKIERIEIEPSLEYRTIRFDFHHWIGVGDISTKELNKVSK